MKLFRTAMAQMNPEVGDIPGNKEKMLARLDEALARGADLVAFPELALTGYPPEDLLLREDFVAENLAALEDLAARTKGKDILVVAGFVGRAGGRRNAAAVIHDGRIADVYHKVHLPNYGVFDERRYFVPGDRFPVYFFRGLGIGVNVCEDIWHSDGPALRQARRGGAGIIVNINASPYHTGKWSERAGMLSARAAETGAFILYANAVGGQDELVFDGGSMAFGPDGGLLARAALFEEKLFVVDVDPSRVPRSRRRPRRRPSPGGGAPAAKGVEAIEIDAPPLRDRGRLVAEIEDAPRSPEEEIWSALVTGTRDYVRKNGFGKVLVGLSGGIDSGVVTAVAADAVGPRNITCLFMPSRYTSAASRRDAAGLAANLGIALEEVSIEKVFRAYLDCLAPAFRGTKPGIAEENIQARIRGNLLMAFSNKFGDLVLTTGNKSEYSTGYATLYGDMSGGFAVLKDVFKTMVYRLARHRNALGAVIPVNMLAKAPTAELKAGQRDSDTLPPYEVLDPILKMYVEEDLSPGEIAARGFAAAAVDRVVALVDGSEYKRRQSPPGVKITGRAFGRDRRMPITNRFRPITNRFRKGGR